VAAYRTLPPPRFVQDRFGRVLSTLRLEDFDVAFFEAFFVYFERDCGNYLRIWNQRLSVFYGFFRYVAFSEFAFSLHCQRILAIFVKRCERGFVAFLRGGGDGAGITPDATIWIGRRDCALLFVAVQTGLRNSEITALRCQDVDLEAGAHVRCVGKGWKTRAILLRFDVVVVLKDWLTHQPGAPADPLFPSIRGGRLNHRCPQRLVTRHTAIARQVCLLLMGKIVTFYSLRHVAAMVLLQRGVDLSVIALWLGHESTETTEVYLHADMRLKERVFAYAMFLGFAFERYRVFDFLFVFLEGL
jgi:hypothetical protein